MASDGITLLKAGIAARKLGTDGKSRKTTLRLSEDGSTLAWTGRRMSLSSKSDDDRTLPVKEVAELDTSDGLGALTMVMALLSSARANKPKPNENARKSFTAGADGRGTLALSFDVSTTQAQADFAAILSALQSMVASPDVASAKEETAGAPDEEPAAMATGQAAPATAAPAPEPADAPADESALTATAAAVVASVMSAGVTAAAEEAPASADDEDAAAIILQAAMREEVADVDDAAPTVTETRTTNPHAAFATTMPPSATNPHAAMLLQAAAAEPASGARVAEATASELVMAAIDGALLGEGVTAADGKKESPLDAMVKWFGGLFASLTGGRACV